MFNFDAMFEDRFLEEDIEAARAHEQRFESGLASQQSFQDTKNVDMGQASRDMVRGLENAPGFLGRYGLIKDKDTVSTPTGGFEQKVEPAFKDMMGNAMMKGMQAGMKGMKGGGKGGSFGASFAQGFKKGMGIGGGGGAKGMLGGMMGGGGGGGMGGMMKGMKGKSPIGFILQRIGKGLKGYLQKKYGGRPPDPAGLEAIGSRGRQRMIQVQAQQESEQQRLKDVVSSLGF